MAFLAMQVFYSTHIEGSHALLLDQEHHHLSKVLRKKEGDIVAICNGKGCMWQAEVNSISKKETSLLLLGLIQEQRENPNHLILAVAPTKNMDRYEWLIEKAVEIGVHSIQAFYSQNSERRNLRLDRLELIALSAMKQSKALFLPEIKPPLSYNDLLKTSVKNRFLAYVRESSFHWKDSLSQFGKEEECIILIGPEGGFTEIEADKAKESGFQAVTLGEKRLRTETAAVFATVAYQLFCK
ncbi:MAG: 16S rRNA (uracil(1498)-N(3))-methyltransferase [Chitinophagales bacterium]|nr:16S rRNA (uracil(1498)-N(3))-methyltransferase [Chitinophagales bacterium]